MQLRTDIVQAARELLIETGSDSTVTLRAIARRVGIAAPSIYAHFDDPDQIVQAVLGEAFAELVARLERARADVAPGRDRLVACCRAYLAFGAEQPALYGLLFSRPQPVSMSGAEEATPPESVDGIVAAIADGGLGDLVGAQAFELLLRDVADAVAEGTAQVASVLTTATELWVSMHGLVLLRATAPQFPWPDPEHLETDLVARIAQLRDPTG